MSKSIVVPIKGMHCRSCELLIEDKLKEIPGVESVKTNYLTGEAEIHYNGTEPSQEQLDKTIVEAGYLIGVDEKLPLIAQDQDEYADLGVAFLFLMALFLLLKSLGLANLDISSDLSSPSFGVVILIGLVAGFSTCMALVGGLSLGLSTKFIENHPQASAKEKFTPHLFFVGGRIIAYAFLGGILGLLGSAVHLSSFANGILTLLVGVVMLVMGLQLVGIFPRLSKYKFTLPKGISKALGIKQKNEQYSHIKAMVMGALTFFLPCGFTQAMQLYAVSTGNFLSGFLVMGLFALGTAPGLLSVGGLTSLVKGSFQKIFFKFAGLAVIFFALFNLNNGFTLANLSIGSQASDKQQVIDPNVTLIDGVQVVRMIESGRGYSPNKFSIKKGVPVKWIIDAQAPYSCASALIVPKLGLDKNLKAGENIIEFTPEETGTLPFSCSMGMYTGVFNVYDDNTPVDSLEAAGSPTSRGGSCGSGGSGACGGSGGSGGCGCGGGSAGCGCGAENLKK